MARLDQRTRSTPRRNDIDAVGTYLLAALLRSSASFPCCSGVNFVLDSYEQRHLFPFDFAFRGQQDPVCFVVAFSSNGACRAFIYPDTATTCLVRISCLWTTDFVFVDY